MMGQYMGWEWTLGKRLVEMVWWGEGGGDAVSV